MVRFLGLGIVVICAVALAGIKAFQLATEEFEYSVSFYRGTTLDNEMDELLADIASKHSQDYVFELKGHTGTQGDIAANTDLSVARADKVKEELVLLGIPENSVSTKGVAGKEPLRRESGESDRAFEARLARVDILVKRP